MVILPIISLINQLKIIIYNEYTYLYMIFRIQLTQIKIYLYTIYEYAQERYYYSCKAIDMAFNFVDVKSFRIIIFMYVMVSGW